MVLLTGERFYNENPLRGSVDVSDADEVYVSVNHGRWIARCPFCDSAMIAFSEPRLFLCAECANQTVGGKAVPVVWPSDSMRKQIETALQNRPVANQNWTPGEKIKTLIEENTLYGVT
jgi:ribosomal protein L37AE/L43A